MTQPKIVLIKDAQLKETRNGSLMVSGKVFDGKDNFPFVMFGVEREIENVMKSGSVIQLDLFKTETYQDKPQFNISSVSNYTGDISNIGLVPECVLSEDELMKKFDDIVNLIVSHNSSYDPLIKSFKQQHWFNIYKKMPAGISKHHAYLRGLLDHSVGVAELCMNFAKHYDSKNVNISLLLFTALFHDIGKIWEYVINPSTHLLEKYSKSGNLHGHIVNTMRVIEPHLRGVLTNEEIDMFFHLVESHHGKLEWGALVEPKTIESFILSQADNLDAGLNSIKTALFDGGEEEWVFVSKYGYRFLNNERS